MVSVCFLSDERVLRRNLVLPFSHRSLSYPEEKINAVIEPSDGPYIPSWQTSPVFIRTLVNRNLLTDPESEVSSNVSFTTASVVFGGFEFAPDDNGTANVPQQTQFYTALLSIQKKRPFPYRTSPVTRIFLPIFDSFNETSKTPVGLVSALIRWESYFVHVVPPELRGINMVINNDCGDVYTFKITEGEPDPVGLGDLHDTTFDRLARMATFDDINTVDDGSPHGLPLNHENCSYHMTSYPNQDMLDDYQTNLPALITLAVACCFAFTFILFVFYDRLVERRQTLVLQRAEQTTAIVQSLFPKGVAEKLMQHHQDMDILTSKNQKLNKFLGGDDQVQSCIADLFPACSVMFADISGQFERLDELGIGSTNSFPHPTLTDIAGFTAWASTRDPSQVFHLLESIYNAFDAIAKSRKVFKVETIGDCYVAVTGLPDPQANHAIIMARFAGECMIKLREVTERLEKTLGDTMDLCMRIGLHSGPVTAGVLRGEKSRFQLFGDTVNTASRMES